MMLPDEGVYALLQVVEADVAFCRFRLEGGNDAEQLVAAEAGSIEGIEIERGVRTVEADLHCQILPRPELFEMPLHGNHGRGLKLSVRGGVHQMPDDVHRLQAVSIGQMVGIFYLADSERVGDGHADGEERAVRHDEVSIDGRMVSEIREPFAVRSPVSLLRYGLHALSEHGVGGSQLKSEGSFGGPILCHAGLDEHIPHGVHLCQCLLQRFARAVCLSIGVGSAFPRASRKAAEQESQRAEPPPVWEAG